MNTKKKLKKKNKRIKSKSCQKRKVMKEQMIQRVAMTSLTLPRRTLKKLDANN